MVSKYLVLLMSLFKSYSFQRVVVAGLYFLSILVAAKFIKSDVYSEILKIMFLAKFIQIANIGATSGYLVHRYSKSEKKIQLDCKSETAFVFTYFIYLFLVSCSMLYFSFYFIPEYFLGISAFLILVPFFVIEPLCRYRNLFFISLIPDIVLCFSLFLIIIYVAMFDSGEVEIIYVCMVAFIVTFSGIIIFGLFYKKISERLKYLHLSLVGFIEIIKLGFPVYLGTAFFMVASGADRLFIPLHVSPNEQSVYFLSIQLITGAMIISTSLNFLSSVDLGQANRNNLVLTRGVIFTKLIKSSIVTLASLVVLLCSVMLLENYFLDGYDNLTVITIYLSIGFSLFYISGSITPLLAYIHAQLKITFLMAFIAGLIVINNVIAMSFSLDIRWIAAVTGIILSVYGVLAMLYTVVQLDKLEKERRSSKEI